MVAAAAAVYASLLIVIDDVDGLWEVGAVFLSACLVLVVAAANCLFWRWRLGDPSKLTASGVAGWVTALTPLSVIAVIWVVAILANIVSPSAD